VSRRRVFRDALILVQPVTPADVSEMSQCSSVLNPAADAIFVTNQLVCSELEHRWDQQIVFSPYLSRQTLCPEVDSPPVEPMFTREGSETFGIALTFTVLTTTNIVNVTSCSL
jgi:hypothetical protein